MTKLTVLVTGATAGFGQAIAKRYLAEGHKVVAAGRRDNRLEELKKISASRSAGSFTYCCTRCD